MIFGWLAEVQDSVPVLNKALSGAEVPHGEQGKTNSSDSVLFVWDLDETLIIFQTLSNGKFAELFQGSKDPRVGSDLGRRWESLILDVCDDYFFYKQVGSYTEYLLIENLVAFCFHSQICLSGIVVIFGCVCFVNENFEAK